MVLCTGLLTFQQNHLLQFHNSFIKPVKKGVSVSGCIHESVLEDILKLQKRIIRVDVFQKQLTRHYTNPIEQKIAHVNELHIYEFLKNMVENINNCNKLKIQQKFELLRKAQYKKPVWVVPSFQLSSFVFSSFSDLNFHTFFPCLTPVLSFMLLVCQKSPWDAQTMKP